MAAKKIELKKALEFDLPFIYNNKRINAVATIMQVHNQLCKPMIRVCLDVHQKTPDVYMYYMIDSIKNLFNYPIPQLPEDASLFKEYEDKYMINDIIKQSLIVKLFDLDINYDDWALV
ncbi:hypothetical protein FRZ67_19295 [Panacibacter ginsenosidivorans]|uniref:Uncharacterized protein n=1 Tax=Panacibacter ginsenosidivorans TaxID=1813871 RepID=A0A5B8VCU5_9BACT|nr:hypothetical protein [Panacibacter ginsenosidivorans]QEC69347.1 hypothetical protein FRZ67_19295 [Panacibacter ginsenosidivorans]